MELTTLILYHCMDMYFANDMTLYFEREQSSIHGEYSELGRYALKTGLPGDIKIITNHMYLNA